jgi:hypothetical protein
LFPAHLKSWRNLGEDQGTHVTKAARHCSRMIVASTLGRNLKYEGTAAEANEEFEMLAPT